MAVLLGRDVLDQFRRVSCYNSPYPAHREGRAVDLYPGGPWVPSPVAGTVRSVDRFGTPERTGTTDTDVLLVVDTGEHLARMLHVEPAVSPGDTVSVGDRLGRAFRSGYFDPWVAPHVHLEFRSHESDPRRASGGLPVALDIEPAAVPWDGSGTVVEVGPSYVVLDRPTHPDPGHGFAGIAAGNGGVFDGGFPHYGTGGIHGGRGPAGILGHELQPGGLDGADRPVFPFDGYTLTANDRPLKGLSFVLARDGSFGARLVDPPPLEIGDSVTVRLVSDGEDNAD